MTISNPNEYWIQFKQSVDKEEAKEYFKKYVGKEPDRIIEHAAFFSVGPMTKEERDKYREKKKKEKKY